MKGTVDRGAAAETFGFDYQPNFFDCLLSRDDPDLGSWFLLKPFREDAVWGSRPGLVLEPGLLTVYGPGRLARAPLFDLI